MSNLSQFNEPEPEVTFKLLGTRVPPKTHDRFKEISEKLDRTISQLLRSIINQFIEEFDKEHCK